MIELKSLVHYLNEYLDSQSISDYCPNGLQVEGAPEVGTLVCGVTASEALIHKAIEHKADAILVHHGYFWKGDDPCVVGFLRNRLALLLKNNISVLAYHLPLDLHPTVGNNVGLAQLLGIDVSGCFSTDIPGLGLTGEMSKSYSPPDFAQLLEEKLHRAPLHISGGKKQIRSVAWCTGAAQDFIVAAAQAGVDAYISGEVSERTFHLARELGVDYYAAGHHATERFGVKTLGEHLQTQFNLNSIYIDIDNPI